MSGSDLPKVVIRRHRCIARTVEIDGVALPCVSAIDIRYLPDTPATVNVTLALADVEFVDYEEASVTAE